MVDPEIVKIIICGPAAATTATTCAKLAEGGLLTTEQAKDLGAALDQFDQDAKRILASV